MKQYLRIAVVAVFAFALGYGVAHTTLVARADAPALQPAAIDLLAVTPDSMPPPSAAFPDLRSKTYVVTDGMTAALQTGTAGKHYHADANEVQIFIAGTGSEWLGDKQVALKPGMMLVIPKGAAHGGITVTSGPLQWVSFKTPPQAATDVHPMQ